ncbi:hypothetical protein OIU77_001362 [Salix suchowensis]|uniref:Uncharacterized protein n=1 Tax=Salix suchowensis TaxID=1278906 RepID=A0ABQ9B158_9ROSI|nr:hypothetical protein OIU77_001362 [Salix suchowensis]
MGLLLVFLAGFSSIFHFANSQASPDAEVMFSLKRKPQRARFTWMVRPRSMQLEPCCMFGRKACHPNPNWTPKPSSLNGLSSLEVILLSDNKFISVPSDFFTGLSSLQSVEIDNNPFTNWVIPESLTILRLAFNDLEGELPASFSGSQIQSLWLNGQKLSGGIDVIQNMTLLREVWLHSNGFSGPLPDFSGLKDLESFKFKR